MKNVLILHGAGNNSQGNWFPWLKNELENKGYKVWVPDLPDSEKPDKKKWLNKVFSNKDWEFNDESVIIGHSAGATCILRILEKLTGGVKIEKSILVAGPCNMGTMPQFFVYKKSLVGDSFNWSKIKASCSKFYLIYSDKDPYDCGIDQGKIIQEHIGGELILKNSQAHFNLEKGSEYKQFPEVLEKILE
jgi:hypothetical protein